MNDENQIMPVTATRLLDHPIIWPDMDDRMGSNINGPAIIRVPDWASGKLGTYHLHFSDHKGTYIRLAYADQVTGPWTLHTPGAMDVKNSLFEPVDPPDPPEEERPAWAKKMAGGYLYAHIASPDVHVDHNARVIRMYYHGLLHNGDQQTRLAVSTDGLTFVPQEPLLGPPYFRTFEFGGFIYTITWGGMLYRSQTWEGPFEQGPQIIPYATREGIGHGFRHGEVHRTGDKLHVFFTRMGDRPERILYTSLALHGDWLNWVAAGPVLVLEPELAWEGSDLPLETSVMGTATQRERALRDPCVFQDSDGSFYLLYCGGGESGIGVAALTGL